MEDAMVMAALGKLVCLAAFVALVWPWVYARLRSDAPDWQDEGNTRGQR